MPFTCTLTEYPNHRYLQSRNYLSIQLLVDFTFNLQNHLRKKYDIDLSQMNSIFNPKGYEQQILYSRLKKHVMCKVEEQLSQTMFGSSFRYLKTINEVIVVGEVIDQETIAAFKLVYNEGFALLFEISDNEIDEIIELWNAQQHPYGRYNP